MMATYPGLYELNYDSPPNCPFNELNPSLWLRLHSLHCTNSPPCSIDEPADSCYFRPLHFMIKYGYHAPRTPGSHTTDIKPHNPAYVSLWNLHPHRCRIAFDKLRTSTKLAPIDKPEFVFPLLPVIKSKDLWRHEKLGTNLKVRLTSDISTAGGNEMFCDWKFKFLALHAVTLLISRGDFLTTRDITGFYNRLPAGESLRRFQCFQDPRSYAKDDPRNNLRRPPHTNPGERLGTAAKPPPHSHNKNETDHIYSSV